MMQPYEQLEHDWAIWNDLDPKGMVACSSGTAALHLAVECVNPNSKSTIAVPDFTMIACPRAVVLAGRIPCFVDCDDSLLMDSIDLFRQVERHISSTMMIVHIYGRVCDLDYIHSSMSKCHMEVIEDLSEAHGVKPHPKTDAACWSFYKNKIVAGEEGGAVYFKDFEKADLARELRTLGFTEKHDFIHTPRGHNYRMSNVHASLIIENLKEADSNIEKRRIVEGYYNELIPHEYQNPARVVPWVYDIRIKGLDRLQQDGLVNNLRKHGARHGFRPMRMQPEFYCSNYPYYNSYRMGCETIYFPIKPEMERRDVEAIANDFVLQLDKMSPCP